MYLPSNLKQSPMQEKGLTGSAHPSRSARAHTPASAQVGDKAKQVKCDGGTDLVPTAGRLNLERLSVSHGYCFHTQCLTASTEGCRAIQHIPAVKSIRKSCRE